MEPRLKWQLGEGERVIQRTERSVYHDPLDISYLESCGSTRY